MCMPSLSALSVLSPHTSRYFELTIDVRVLPHARAALTALVAQYSTEPRLLNICAVQAFVRNFRRHPMGCCGSSEEYIPITSSAQTSAGGASPFTQAYMCWPLPFIDGARHRQSRAAFRAVFVRCACYRPRCPAHPYSPPFDALSADITFGLPYLRCSPRLLIHVRITSPHIAQRCYFKAITGATSLL